MKNSPKKCRGDQENISTQYKIEIVGFEIPNKFIRAVTKSAEWTEEKV